MSLLPILTWPDKRLATRAEQVVWIDEVGALVADMLETMYAAPGRGLAAPQVGRLIRLFVMDVGWKEGNPSPVAMINPEITWFSPSITTVAEGCLSIPGIVTDVDRPEAVDMNWTEPDGTRVWRRLKGAEARCAQHELDHLDGIVTLDRLAEPDRALALTAYEAARG